MNGGRQGGWEGLAFGAPTIAGEDNYFTATRGPAYLLLLNRHDAGNIDVYFLAIQKKVFIKLKELSTLKIT